MTTRTSKLNCEHLESREMMAGDITAFVSSGHLYVVEAYGEAGQGQAAAISQLADGRLRVKGLTSQDGGTSLVNGAAYKDFWVSGDLKVDFRAGNDTLQLVRNTAIKGIDINMSSSSSVAATDRDYVYVDGIRTDNQLNIRTGVGPDTVKVWDSVIGNDGSIYDNLDITTGAGRDIVEIFRSTRSMEVKGHIYVNTYSAGEAETDRVTILSALAGRHISISTGNGQDIIAMTDVWTGSDVLISAGEGNDTVSLREVRATDDFWVYLHGGDDKLDIQYLNCDQLTLDGGAGYDSFSSSVPGHSNGSTVTGFEA